jgi:hypothetical protein
MDKTLLPLDSIGISCPHKECTTVRKGGKNTHINYVEEHADLCIAAGITFEGLIKKQLVDSGNLTFVQAKQVTNLVR